MQQRWSATEKEIYAVHQSVLKFELYLRGVECILHYNHRPLEPFLSKGMKIQKLDWWAMELADYDITFVHTKGSNNILADSISRLKMEDIYMDPIGDPNMLKANNLKQHVMEVNANKIHTLYSNVLNVEQKWDITCKKLTIQCHCINKYTFWTVVLSANGILHRHQYIHSLKHDVTIFMWFQIIKTL